MSFRIDVHIHNHGGQATALQQKELEQIMADLTALTAAVARETEVDESAIVLLRGLKSQLDAAGTDPVALKSLSDKLGSESRALADAVVANTPAA